jgi:hypothetical protein
VSSKTEYAEDMVRKAIREFFLLYGDEGESFDDTETDLVEIIVEETGFEVSR